MSALTIRSRASVLAPLFSIALVSLAWLLAARRLIRIGQTRPDASERFDAIVVLGCRVTADGKPGLAFARRLETGCALFRAGAAPTLVITGGKVGAPVSEADAGRAYIGDRDLAPLEAIVLEDRARTTRENATRVRALLGDVRVLVVTTDWHVARAGRIFARSFAEIRCAGAPGKLRGALREVAPWLLDLARPKRPAP